MNNIKLLTDTGCDLLEELIKEDVGYIPLYTTFDGTNFLKQRDELSIEEFYKKLEDNNTPHPKTSCPSVDDYCNIFNKYINEGKSILMICINSLFSGAYQAAEVAKNMILENNKDAKIELIDSKSCTYVQYILCKKAKEMIDEDIDIETIKHTLEIMKNESRVFMYVDDLTCLAKSGRVTNLKAGIASILNIKPILELKDGILESTKKAKGQNKAIREVISDFNDFLNGKDINDYKIGIIHGDRYEDALLFRDTLNVGDIDICQLGVCIGTHAGPTLLGVVLAIKSNGSTSNSPSS